MFSGLKLFDVRSLTFSCSLFRPEPAPSRPVDLEQEPDTGDLAHALGSRIDVRAIIKAIYEELDEDIPDDFEDVEVDRDDMPDFQEVQSNVQRGIRDDTATETVGMRAKIRRKDKEWLKENSFEISSLRKTSWGLESWENEGRWKKKSSCSYSICYPSLS